MVQELPVQVPLGNVVFIFPVSILHERKIQIEAESQSVYSVLHLILTCYILCSFFVFVSMFSFCPGYHSVFNVQVVDSQDCVERNREHDAGRLPAPAVPHIRVAVSSPGHTGLHLDR